MSKLTLAIEKIFNHKAFLVLVVITCLYTQGRQSDKYFGWTNPKNTIPEHLLTINSDGAGYYAYMPQLFIYRHQPHFQFLEGISKKYNTISFINGIGYDQNTHKGIDKYYIGSAVCITPFFLTNHCIQKLSYGSGDGYSKSYQLTVSIAALFYWLLGIIGLIKLLRKFKVTNFLIGLIILIISLGTSLNYYTVYLPSFSHVYSFCIITWFIYFGYCWQETKKTNYFIALGICLGLIFIIRPTNSLIVFMIPFLFTDWKTFMSELSFILKNKKSHLFLSVLFFGMIVFCQLLVIHSQTGKWAINTYSTEHFDYLTNPKLYEVMFGFEKGFFIYAPVMLILIPSVFYLVKKGRYFALGWSFVFLTFLYLTSSWWCWWYGGGLGMRPFIDFLSFLVIPIALFLQHIHPLIKAVVIIFTITMIYFYQILQIQFNLNILHYNKMSQENFWKVFLKTDERFSWVLHFKDDHIEENKIRKSDHFYFDKFSWDKTATSNKPFTLEVDMPDVSFVYHPEPTWKNSIAGIRIQGEMKISNENSNPCFVVNYYYKGLIVKNSNLFIGNTLDELNELLPFSKDHTPKLTYSKIDSIGITMLKGAPPTTIKNLSFTFYSLKK